MVYTGFVHTDLNKAPTAELGDATSSTITGLDFAGNNPTMFVRVGNGDASDGQQVALTSDSGTTWYVVQIRDVEATVYQRFSTGTWITAHRAGSLAARSHSLQTVILSCGALLATVSKFRSTPILSLPSLHFPLVLPLLLIRRSTQFSMLALGRHFTCPPTEGKRSP